MGFGSGSDDFNDAGPTHLKHVDWTNQVHKRKVAACLVMGVYVLERDRQEEGKRDPPLAEPWFSTFNFKLDQPLIHDKDKSIYGAIYKFKYPSHLPPEAPLYVIAFRGTVLKKKSVLEDLRLDINILHQCFHKRKRTRRATEVVESVVFPKEDPAVPRLKVWLVGHSLGSALAIQAGKNVAKKLIGTNVDQKDILPTFLFNPPYPSLATDKIGHAGVKQCIEKMKRKNKVNLVNLVKDPQQLAKDKACFANLSRWSPHLFVNRNDLICSGYIGYFERRKKSKDINSEEWMLDAMYSARALLKDNLKEKIKNSFKKVEDIKKDSYYEPFYRLPSATLTINDGLEGDVGRVGHGICQWWREDLQLNTTSYLYDHCN